jgi:hypothetical protein
MMESLIIPFICAWENCHGEFIDQTLGGRGGRDALPVRSADRGRLRRGDGHRADEALQQLRCRSRVEPPRVDDGTIRAVAATFCFRRVDVVGVRVSLQKYDDGDWKDVENDVDINRDARRAEASAETRCERGRYRTVAINFARDRGERFRDSEESDDVRIRCR